MTYDLAINLLAVAVGFIASSLYRYAVNRWRRRSCKRFWVPATSSRITVLFGAWHDPLRSAGELEGAVNVKDAIAVGKLKYFLEGFYNSVTVEDDINRVDWQNPVVSLGGPLPNKFTDRIGKSGVLPVWFHGLPYDENSERALWDRDANAMYRSTVESGRVISDVGFVARVKSPENDSQHVFVLASNYGIGINGLVEHLTDCNKVSDIQGMMNGKYFQIVIQTRASNGKVASTRLLGYTNIA